MPRRPTSKASRAIGASARPTPIHSARSTPLSSAYPSTYASEAEWDPDDDVNNIPISALVLRDSASASKAGSSGAADKPRAPKPFRFLDLPSELRLKIYGFHFEGAGQVVDLDPDNHKRIHKRLALLRVCRTLYGEASHYFYSTRTFRVFPTHPGRFFRTKRPLLSRLKPHQRACITSLELRLGPGWNRPPRGWVVSSGLGLGDCAAVRRLTVFVECDPSDSAFNGFRRADGFYEAFSQNLLEGVLAELPLLDRVCFDAWSSVKKSGAMMRTLLEATAARGRKVGWGPERGWSNDKDEDYDEPTAAIVTAATPVTAAAGFGLSGAGYGMLLAAA